MKILVISCVMLALSLTGDVDAVNCAGGKLNEEQKAWRNYTGPKLVSTGISDTAYRWPKVNGQVIVPYMISSAFSAADIAIIKEGMKTIDRQTCIRFVPKTSAHVNYLNIKSLDGCWSLIGNQQQGSQDLSLQIGGCVDVGTVMHELGHALGFDHMHNNFDRDLYVDIYEANIEPENFSQYDKILNTEYENFNTKYDFKSIMHYDRTSFALPNLDAMLPKARYSEFADTMGRYNTLSPGDIRRFNTMYKCLVNGRQF